MPLTNRQQEIVRLREEDGYTYKRISQSLKISVSTVKTHYYSAKKIMAKMGADIADINQGQIVPANAQDLADHCTYMAKRILNSIDEACFQKATLNQKAYAFNVFIEKSRLLMGEATQIISHEDSRALKDLLPAVLLEAQRRGLTIEGEAKDVTPQA